MPFKLDCPYCGAKQPEWPKQRKKKCVTCKQVMHVRCTTLIARKHTEYGWDGWGEWKNEALMTEKEAWLCDYFYLIVAHSEPKKAIFQQWKTEHNIQHESRYRDNVWGMLNNLLNEYMEKSDYAQMEDIYRQQAKFLKEEGKDPYIQIQQAGKMRLLVYKQGNCRQVDVEVFSGKGDPDPCPVCLALNKKRLSFEHALRELPLPPRECKNKYCDCYYAQVFNF